MIISAVLVALVGVLMKRSDDKLVFRALLSISSAGMVFPAVFFVPLPPSSVWPYLILGALVHFFYQVSYVAAFERGDMSLVYPIMRGIAPAIIAVLAFAFLEESLTTIEAVGLLIVVLALIGFSWPLGSNIKEIAAHAIGIAIICGAFIALYSVVDAAGMRLSKTILSQAWTYIVWFFLLDVIGMSLLVLWRRGLDIRRAIKDQFRPAILAGGLSLISFSLALYAFTLAPIAKMSAMRETSVVFGAIFAVLILGEKFGRQRISLAGIMVFGLFLLQK